MRAWHALVLVTSACGSPQSSRPPVEPVRPAPAGHAGTAAPASARGTRPPRYDARTFYEHVAMTGASFSHDGSRILVASDATGVFNVYAYSVAGGPPVQLTASAQDANFAVSFFPRDDRFLYSADSGGNELTHLWVRERDGNDWDLTPGAKVKAMFVGWSQDGKWFHVATNERDARFFDLYRYATDDYARTLAYHNDGYQIDEVSPDGRWLALTKVIDNAASDIYLVDLAADTKAARPITESAGRVEHRPFTFTADSKKLVYSTNGAAEFAQAWSHDLATGAQAAELATAWDVTSISFSEHGRYRVAVTNEDARSVLSTIDLATGRTVAPRNLPPGDIVGAVFDRGEKRMAFYLSSDRTPADLYVLDLATGATKRLSSNSNAKVDPAHLVAGQVVRYQSFDGLAIPAILYRPAGAGAEARAPAVVWVHGGPGGQSRLGYSALIQYIVNHGYAVLAVNNRGSSGYGKTFHHLDDRKHGDVDLQDCVYARKYLATLDWIDGARVGIVGGSYGGYMTVAALAFAPDAFDVGIDIFGVTNWVRTLESIPPWWASFRDGLYAELGDPATDKERLTARSPLFHAKNITKPLLVVQGANDPRVLKVESDEIVAAVQGNGVPVEYLVFADEGHGFLQKKNSIAAAEKYVAFLDRYLAGRR